MARPSLFVLTAVGMFGLAAATSWLLQQSRAGGLQPERTGTVAALAGGAEDSFQNQSTAAADPSFSEASATGDQGGKLPVAVRAPYSADSVEVVRIAANMRDRMAAIRKREEELEQRQTQLELIQADILGEQNTIDALRKQVSEELQAIEQKMAEVERRHAELQQNQQKVSDRVSEMQSQLIELKGDEQANLKKLASVYNSMQPREAAALLSAMANSGNLETAVQLLGLMQERKAASVLASLPDQTLAVQLTEKLKHLKNPRKKRER